MLSSESKDINALPDAKQNKHGVEFGQVWALGDHRLICGDSLKQETYEKLLQGEKADFIFTDPPYNVDYDYTKVGLGPTGNKKYHSKGKLFNDKLSDTEFESFLENCFKNALAFSQGNMAVYCCSASRTAIQFRDALLRAGLSYRQTIVWIKERFIFALGEDFHRCYEPILYLKKGKPYVDKKLCTESDVWGLNYIDFADQLDAWYNERDKAVEYVHPTQKPVGLVCRALRKSSKEGWIVLDMFGGSGTTLMACEQMKRKARLIELDPFYCSAIIERWQSFTGKKAFKL